MIDPVHIRNVLIALRATPKAFTAAVADFPSESGLYALWGSASTWRDLGLGTPPDERPLYVGKSETDLMDRPLCQHFQHRRTARATKRATSLTGWSTPRRSFAALLRDAGGLKAVPRNPQTPGCFDRYGLSREHDDWLTAWMRNHLTISIWKFEGRYPLADAEDAVVLALGPPLNLDIETPWRTQIDGMRRKMAAEAWAWRMATQ